MGASDLTIYNKQHKISPSESLPPQRRGNNTRWPTFRKKSTEVGVKNGKRRITQITCHCLFSLKKRQSVRFSGVPLFSYFTSSRALPSISPVDRAPRSKPSRRRYVNISGEPSGCVSRHLRDTEASPTPRNYPISGGSPGAQRHHLSRRKTLLFLPNAHVRQKEIFLIRDENKCI